MIMSRKVIIVSFLFILLFSYVNLLITNAEPTVTAPNAVLIDYKTGEVLYEKNAHEITFPASTTKVMTAILALENADLNDVIEIDYDIHVGGAGMYLLKGETFTVEEFLNALMIRSANDVAEALAIHISGSVEEFASLMNKRAKELGAFNTNFTNPHGMPDEDHVTTAYDLAMIGRHAMTFDLLREIAANGDTITFEPTEFTPETRYYRNTNRFLWGTGAGNQMLYNGSYTNIKYDIIDGLKTGYTRAAGNCLISSAYKDGHRLIGVVLGAQGVNVYSDTRSIIDYGYDNYQLLDIITEGSFKLDANVKNGIANTVPLHTATDLSAALPASMNTAGINKEIILSEDITAPVLQGDALGKVVYSIGDEVLGEIDLIAGVSIGSMSLVRRAMQPSIIIVTFIILFLLWQLLVICLRLKKKKIRSFSMRTRNRSYRFSNSLLKSESIYKKRK
ncbi:MAG: D-alanyl-D-alanine carboxypeptidase [Clostridiaceae bacterium]|nr:D-alanyl-D-alanine carboxypeptidase [Clostridiaceae bacterium]